MTSLGARFPLAAGRAVWGLAERARAHHAWTAGGVPPPPLPAELARTEATDAGVFAVTAAPTLGVGGLALGAWRIDTIGASAGAVASEGQQPTVLALLGWAPWHLLRIAGYICLLVTLSDVTLARLGEKPVRLRHFLRGLGPAIALLAAGWAAELTLSVWWQTLLHAWL
jgi:hypothetical protein